MADLQDDNRRIEVGVSWLSGADSNAAVQFADSVKQANEVFKNLTSTLGDFTKTMMSLEAQRKAEVHASTMQNSGIGVSVPPSIPPTSPAQVNQDLGDYAAKAQMSIVNLIRPRQQTIPPFDIYGPQGDRPAWQVDPNAQQSRLDPNQPQLWGNDPGYGPATGNLFGTPFDETSAYDAQMEQQRMIAAGEVAAQEAQAAQVAQDAQDGLNAQQAAQAAQAAAYKNSPIGGLKQRFINENNKMMKLKNLTSLGHGHVIGIGAAGVAGAAAGGGDDNQNGLSINDSLTHIVGTTLGTGVATTLEGGLFGSMLGAGQSIVKGTFNAVTDPFKQGISMLTNVYGNQAAGAQLGYQRGGSFLGLPIANPFSPATSEGYRQQADAIGLAFQHGINLTQARQIEQASAGYGFSGSFGGQVTDRLLAPLFQQNGMDPNQTLTNFGSSLRTGAATVDQLRQALDNMGQSARAASMTLSDTSNAVAQASQNIQSIGGMPLQGIRFGEQFQQLTGLPASVGGQLATNPFVQSIIATQTGVMPSVQGTLGATAIQGGIGSAVEMTSRLFGHSFLPHTTTVRNPLTGAPMYTETDSGQQQGDALAAQFLGIDVQTYERLKKNVRATQMGTALGGMASRYTGQIEHGAISNATIQHSLESGGMGQVIIPNIGTVQGKTVAASSLPPGAKVISNNPQAGTYQLQMPDGTITTQSMSSLNLGSQYSGTSIQNELRAMQHSTGKAGGSEVYWNQIMGNLRDSGLWSNKIDQSTHRTYTQDEINRLNNISNPTKRASALQTDISNQMKKHYQGDNVGGTTIKIAMVGQAAKMFKANPNSVTINANSGTGPTANYQIATPQGMSPLTGYTGYDSGQYESY